MGTSKRESDPGRVELRRAAGKFGPSRADDIFTWPPWVAPTAIHIETLRVSGRGLHSARMKLPSRPQGSASPSPPPRRLRLVRYACRLRGNLAGHRPTSRRNRLVTFSGCATLCRRDAPPVTNAARTRSDYASPEPPGMGTGRARLRPSSMPEMNITFPALAVAIQSVEASLTQRRKGAKAQGDWRKRWFGRQSVAGNRLLPRLLSLCHFASLRLCVTSELNILRLSRRQARRLSYG